MEKVNHYDELITMIQKPTWLGRLLGRKPHTLQYRGSCTVWHRYPTGDRAGKFVTESQLSNIWTREKWKRDDNA